jgi:hypothetical protein
MIDFMVSKLAGKQLDLFLDEKKKACKVFVKLYFSMEQLEEITSEFLADLEPITRGEQTHLSPSFSLAEMSVRIDNNSQNFLEAVDHLSSVLEVYDPILRSALSQLSYYKFSFLMTASRSFMLEKKEGYYIEAIKYDKPVDKVMGIDLEEHYQWLEKVGDVYSLDYDLEWPQNILVYFFNDEDIEEGRINIRDKESLVEFYNLLKPHAEIMSTARERLRELIKSKFSIEDVLFVSSRIQ